MTILYNDSKERLLITNFWEEWQRHRNYLYNRCLYWMGNSTDAEDALSQAAIKAWEAVRAEKGAIKNIKAWLTRLTYNLCMDIHRKFQREIRRVGSLDVMSFEVDSQFVSQGENPFLSA